MAIPSSAVTSAAPSVSSAEPEQQTAVDKALTLLKQLAEHDREIGVSELARHTGLTKSTAFRLLGILQRNDLVERVGSNYRLGTQLFDLGTRVYGPTSLLLRERLLPHLADLYELTHETVHLAVLHDTDIVYINKIHGHRATRSPPASAPGCPPTARGSARPCWPSTTTPPRRPSRWDWPAAPNTP